MAAAREESDGSSEEEEEEDITGEELIRLYRTPGHPIAFSSPGTVYKFFKGAVTEEFIRETLESIDSYTLHREYKKTRFYNPHYVFR